MTVKDWFPVGRDNSSHGWRLDIVSLLAVIGETSIAEHAQALTSSRLCLLPRIIPAPQALLKAVRPTSLPPSRAIVVGAYSGVKVDSLNYFADLLHNIDELKRYEFREYDVGWTDEAKKVQEEQLEKQQSQDREQGPNKISEGDSGPPVVGTHRYSPLSVITLFSFFATLGLFIWAACISDAVACLSIFSVSVATSLGCAGQWWRPKLARRPSNTLVPPGDVVIRTRNGAFIVVHCTDEVARELYVSPEECEYHITDDTAFKAMSGAGIFLFMIGVVLLGNCSWTMQAAIGVFFVLLNGAYWSASLAPKKLFWDVTRFDRRPTTKKHFKTEPGEPNFTRTMWYAIQATGKTKWVAQSGAAPKTNAWKEWLKLAYENRANRDWDAVGAKDVLMKQAAEEEQEHPEDPFSGEALEHVPLEPVPRSDTLSS